MRDKGDEAARSWLVESRSSLGTWAMDGICAMKGRLLSWLDAALDECVFSVAVELGDFNE